MPIAQAIERYRLPTAQTGQLVLAGRVQHGHGPVVDPCALKSQEGGAPVQAGSSATTPVTLSLTPL